jgi:hypothetical protein
MSQKCKQSLRRLAVLSCLLTIVLTPSLSQATVALAPCSVSASFTGDNSQTGRLFRDGIASTCPGKAYPGLFNPLTSYYYETFTYSNPGASAVCVTVNFDPNSGATPCATNAHASAYLNSYDPNNQSANFLGDVGSSVTQPFSFEVPAASSFVLVVTNTASEDICDFSFQVDNLSSCTPSSTPPGLSISFSPAAITAGHKSTLSFVINNSANGVDATGLTLNDSLPAGVVVADPSGAAATCTGGTITAVPGSGVIDYSGGTVPAGSVCTIQVDVTSTTAGIYSNLTGDLTSNLGDSGTANADLTVIAAPVPVPALPGPGPWLLAAALGLAGALKMRFRLK